MKASVNNQQEAPASPQAILTPAPAGSLQRKCACGGSSGVGGDCEECGKKRLTVQRFPADRTSLAMLQQSLAATPSRFGHDLSKVRVHNHVPQGVQTKLNVNEPGDQFEQEADRVAEQITQRLYAPASPVEPTPPSANTELIGRDNSASEDANSNQGELGVEGNAPATEPMTEPAPTEAPSETEAAPAAAPAPEADSAAAPQEGAASGGLIVEDDAGELAPGQMRKGAFLDQLRSSVCATAENVLSAVGRTAQGCPYIEGWIDYYRTRSGQQTERAIKRYAPETADATSASDYIPLINARIRRGVLLWAATGEITGVPEELQGQVASPGMGQTDSGGAGGGRKIAESVGRMFFKSREGGPRDADPQQIQSQLAAGQPLQSDLRSRMESAFGYDFSQVRVHTDSNAASLASEVNARAFTIGSDIAFGAGEYQPGNLIGDALLAHELAHVVQQGNSNPSSEPLKKGDGDYNALEEDADNSAVQAMISAWGGAKGALAEIGRNAMPRLKSGLRLSRCKSNNSSPTSSNAGPTGTTGSAPGAGSSTPTNCVCCIENIQIKNVTNINQGTWYGHSFNTEFSLNYVATTGPSSDCTLRWMEKTNLGYTRRMAAANNVWYDMTQDPQTSPSFVAWNARRKPCPGPEVVTDTDPPAQDLSLPATYLEFRIIVDSGTGAPCTNTTNCITARQDLAPTNTNPRRVQTQTFVHPNPGDTC